MGLRNVRKGSTGPDVLAIQQGLNKYYNKHVLDEDGVFGNETDRVVQQFQHEKGMDPPDGIVGPIRGRRCFPSWV
jgi:peptidoglycan hydrolase-like protein with peptidoglycan-binding domain